MAVRAMNDLSQLRLEYEWQDGHGVRAPELAASWARLEVWVGDQCITLVEDSQSMSARRGVYCSLYPLAEWVSFNWWLLQTNVRPASANRRVIENVTDSWRPHHAVRAAGDGFLWPDLLVLPEGAATRLIWRRDENPCANSPVRYLTSGEALVDTQKLVRVLAHLVVSVVERLREMAIAETALDQEWQAIAEADVEERDFCVAVARLGRDPYNVSPPLQALVERSDELLTRQLLSDFLDSVSLDKIESGLDWIGHAMRMVDEADNPVGSSLSELRESVSGLDSGPFATPWTRGWSEARAVREVRGLESTVSFNTHEIIHQISKNHVDRSLEAVGGLSASGAGILVTKHKLEEPQAQFAGARALWHLVHGGSERFLLTKAHADRQRTERAFAAELIAPADGVAKLLGPESGLVASEDIEGVADHFGVSSQVIRHQAENQLALEVN